MSITTVFNFSNSDIKIRYKEPFLSEGLNSKLNIALPSGVYRGFRLDTNGSALTVTISGDPVYSDCIAVIETSNAYSLTVKRTSGFSLSLATVALGTIAVIAITGVYSTGVTTTASIKAYGLSDYNALTDAQKAALVVLGTVTLPGSVTTIPAANITHARRNSAWERVAREAYLPSLLMRNPGFEYGPITSTGKFIIPFWENEVTTSNADFRLSTTESNAGEKCVEFNVTNSAASISGSLYQFLNVPVIEDQLVKIQLYLKVLTASTSLDSAGNIFIEWGDSTGAVLSTSTNTLGIAGTPGSFTKVDATFVVPTNAAHIRRIGISLTAATYAATGIKFRIDDFNAFLEAIDATRLTQFESQVSQQLAAPLIIRDPDSIFTDEAVLLRYDSSETSLVGERSDQDSSATPISLDWRGKVEIGNDLQDDETQALIPRISTIPSTATNVDYTLMWESLPDSEKAFRMYITPEGTYIGTQNCSWSGTDWSKDVSSETASKLEFSKNGMALYLKKATGDTEPWDDTIGVAGWTNKHIDFNGSTLINTLTGRSIIGDDLIGTLANAILPRIRTNLALSVTTARTLVWDAGDGQDLATRTARIYSTPTGGTEIVSNAYWNGSFWLCDDTSEDAVKIEITNSTFIVRRKEATVATWTDLAWTEDNFKVTTSSDFVSINGTSVIGNGKISSNADSILPRILMNSGTTKTLMQSMDNFSSNTAINIYGNASGELEIVIGAYWDGTQWSADTGGPSEVHKIKIATDGLHVFRKSDNSSSWSDTTGWDNTSLSFTLSGRDNPANTVGFTNTLVNKNIMKAWGVMELDSSPTWSDGFNFSNTISQSGGDVTVTFASPMSTANYAVCMGLEETTGNFSWCINTKTINGFKFRIFDFDSSTAAPVDFTLGGSTSVSIMVIGPQ